MYQEQINTVGKSVISDEVQGQWLVRCTEASPDDLRLGGKARALAALGKHGLPVPPWFVVLPDAFQRSLGSALHDEITAAADTESTKTAIKDLKPAADVLDACAGALNGICREGDLVAVRSSAVDEDGTEHSFAGQLDSFLYVTPERLAERIADVWRSGFSERLLAYRRENNLSNLPPAPAVLVQRMIDSDAAGVAFGADPVSGRRSIAVIGAVYGVGTSLVSGECDADTYHVNVQGVIIRKDVADKHQMHKMGDGTGEGTKTLTVEPGKRTQPVLTDGQIRAVWRLVRKGSRHFGRPQDIEWAIENDRLYLLQSRPITSLGSMPDPDGPLMIWDNSNIIESYSGVTTPLTFTFVRRAYEEVYREFCRLLSVPEQRVESASDVFANMVGLVRGRVYYNLLNWYRVLAMLPGFTMNRQFMEQMMGVREGLPPEVSEQLKTPSFGDKVSDGIAFVRTLGGLIRSHWKLPATRDAFMARLSTALATPATPLEDMRLDQLSAYYKQLEQTLLRRWDAPLVNDFLAMIFYGVLGKLVTKWCGDTDGSLHNNLICGEGGMISAEPAQRIRAMAEIAAADKEVCRGLEEDSAAEIETLLRRRREFRKAYRSYLQKFGDRCLEELKLETATLEDEPLPLLRSVAQLAMRLRESNEPEKRIDLQIRQEAEERVANALAGHPVRKYLFNRVLKHARGRVRDRENLRFERTRVFGRVRRIFLEMGARLAALNLLDEARDVFYLELHELLGLVDGTATTMDLRGLVSLRKHEYEQYASEPATPERFQTHGYLIQGIPKSSASATTAFQPDADPNVRRGLGCCPGIVTARVRVIRDPRGAVLQRGDILVAERTDPGWILLFPSAAGILVERGSLLSHSAIVSREMGIPSIVSIPGLLQWLNDGDLVEMDGARGIIRKVKRENIEQGPDNEH